MRIGKLGGKCGELENRKTEKTEKTGKARANLGQPLL